MALRRIQSCLWQNLDSIKDMASYQVSCLQKGNTGRSVKLRCLYRVFQDERITWVFGRKLNVM
jgi:hypothetical protein